MVIDPRLAQQSTIPGMYTTDITAGMARSLNSAYHTMPVEPAIEGARIKKVFSGGMYATNPYHPYDVDESFLQRLQVYTDAMLAGEIPKMSTEYLFAVKAAMSRLQAAQHRLSPETIERLWDMATKEKGHMAENFAHIVQDYLTSNKDI